MQQEKQQYPIQQTCLLNSTQRYLQTPHVPGRDNTKRLKRNEPNFLSSLRLNTTLKDDSKIINNKYSLLKKDFLNIQNENKELKQENARYSIILSDLIAAFNGVLNQQIEEEQLLEATQTIIKDNIQLIKQNSQKLEQNNAVNQDQLKSNLIINQQAKIMTNDEFMLSQMINQAKQNIQLSEEDEFKPLFESILEQFDNFIIVQEQEKEKNKHNDDQEEENQLLRKEIEILQVALNDNRSYDIYINSSKLTLTHLISNFWTFNFKNDLSCYSKQIGIIAFDSKIINQFFDLIAQNNEVLMPGTVNVKNLNNFSLLSVILNEFQLSYTQDVSDDYFDKIAWNEFWIKYLIENDALLIFVAENIRFKEIQFISYLKKIKSFKKNANIVLIIEDSEQFKHELNIISFSEKEKIRDLISNIYKDVQVKKENMLQKLKKFIEFNCNYFFLNENELINFQENQINQNCIHLKLQVDFFNLNPTRSLLYQEIDPLIITLTNNGIVINYQNLKRILVQNYQIYEHSILISLLCQKDNFNFERILNIQQAKVFEQLKVYYEENKIILS